MVKIANFDGHKHSTSYLLNQTVLPPGRRGRRIGMASVGNPCMRAIWMKFRWSMPEAPLQRRINRLFNVGHLYEELTIKDLKEIGINITDAQKQVDGWGGHIVGFIDGIAHGVPEAPKTPHLWENKTANDRNFKRIKKKGCKEGEFKHYVQITLYMGKLKLTRCLYTVSNKNDSEVYVERVHFNQQDYNEYMSKAIDVVSHENAPPNLFMDPNKQACKWCPASPICYEGETPQKSCRNCVRVDIEEDGKWSCNLLEKELTFDEQIAACDKYRPLELT